MFEKEEEKEKKKTVCNGRSEYLNFIVSFSPSHPEDVYKREEEEEGTGRGGGVGGKKKWKF